MPKYTVIVTRDLTESTVVEVEAVNEDAAELVAFEKVLNAYAFDGTSPVWEIDDGSWDHSSPYITDVSLS
jgi:hypothetical protein